MSRALKNERIEEEVDEEQAGEIEKRIFINHVDTYHGKHLAKFFAKISPEPIVVESNDEENGVPKKHLRFNDDQSTGDSWKVFGTVQTSKNYDQPSFIHSIVQSNNRRELLDHLVHMNVIIYDITRDAGQIDEAIWICQRLESMSKNLVHPITFILLSTIMTWARTQSSEENLPFTDDDLRRRRAHTNYKEHHNAEKIITKLGLKNKDKFFTYVVAAGLTYGMEEEVFHYLFKSAWHNTPELSVYGDGNNFLPTIHILDLATILQNLADHQYKIRYIIATDSSKDTLLRITRKVSQVLGTGKIVFVEQEDIMLNKDVTQTDSEMLSINLQFIPMFVKENMLFKWRYESGLVEHMSEIVEEFRLKRNLTPIKICLFGPPASGKTTIAKQLAHEYRLHHLQIKDVLENIQSELERLVKYNSDHEDEFRDDEYEEISIERMDETRNLLEKLEDLRRDSKSARLDDDTLTQVFKMKLMSSPCQNQGYILDGYPKTFDQAQSLFGSVVETGDENDEEKKILINERIFPDYVFILEAENVFLRQRILYLPEKLVADTHNTEIEFKRRLKFYNDLGDDFHPARYFEDLDRLCETFKIDEDQSFNHRSIVEKIMERIQKPHAYGLNDEEEEELIKKRELIEKEKREREEREERERIEFESINEQKRKHQEWNTKLEQFKQEQKQILNTQSLPLRDYLMRHVMPTLTKALIECCQTQPEDPVDFVAEYLFKNNPQM